MTISISLHHVAGSQASSAPFTPSGSGTVDGLEDVWGTGTNGHISVNTTSVLEVNYDNEIITGVGICDSTTHRCSTGYATNGWAQCYGPAPLSSGQGGTIAYEQEQLGAAAGIFLDHGYAAYPLSQYNLVKNAWTFGNPASSSWTFGGVQCIGWSFSFPNP